MNNVSKSLAAAIVTGALLVPFQAGAWWSDDGTTNTNWDGRAYNNMYNNAYSNMYGNGWGDSSGDADVDGDVEIIIKSRGRGRARGNSRGSFDGRGYGSGYNNWDNRFQNYGDYRYDNYGYGPRWGGSIWLWSCTAIRPSPCCSASSC